MMEGSSQTARMRSLIWAHYPQTESLDNINVSVESKYPDETAHVHDDMNPHILHMLECTLSLDDANVLFVRSVSPKY